jgi:hypothetical protein
MKDRGTLDTSNRTPRVKFGEKCMCIERLLTGIQPAPEGPDRSHERALESQSPRCRYTMSLRRYLWKAMEVERT